MSYEQYNTALNAGRKEYRACLLKGGYPYLPALDEILSYAKVEYCLLYTSDAADD